MGYSWYIKANIFIDIKKSKVADLIPIENIYWQDFSGYY